MTKNSCRNIWWIQKNVILLQPKTSRDAQLWHTNRVSHRDNHGGKKMRKCLTT